MLPREIAITFCGMLQLHRQQLDLTPTLTIPQFKDCNKVVLRNICKKMKQATGLRFDNHRVLLSIDAGIAMFMVGEGRYSPKNIFIPSDDHIQY